MTIPGSTFVLGGARTGKSTHAERLAVAQPAPVTYVAICPRCDGASAAVAGWWAGPFVGAAIVGTFAVVRLSVRKVCGLVGDALGAVEQVVECLVMIVGSGLAARSNV